MVVVLLSLVVGLWLRSRGWAWWRVVGAVLAANLLLALLSVLAR